jgi:invasion protein IalB
LYPAKVLDHGGEARFGRRENMMASLRRFAGLLLTAALSLTGLPIAQAQGVLKSVQGDWQVRCDTPSDSKTEVCALIQSVTAEDRPNVGLTVIILKTVDQKGLMMRVLAPLGVLLTEGLRLKIGQKLLGPTGFVYCIPNGCVAEFSMDEKLVSLLKSGQEANFIIFSKPEEGIGIPVSLAGLGQGLDKLP